MSGNRSRSKSKSNWRRINVFLTNGDHIVYDLNEYGRLNHPFEKTRRSRFKDYRQKLGEKMCFPCRSKPHRFPDKEKIPDNPLNSPCLPTQSGIAKEPGGVSKSEIGNTQLKGPPTGGVICQGTNASSFLSNFPSPSDLSQYWPGFDL